MMKKYGALALCLLLLCGCSGQTVQPDEDKAARAVYFLTETEQGTELGYEVVSFEKTEDVRQQILDTLAAMGKPINKNDHSLFGENISVREAEVFGSTIVIRLSESYDSLSALDKSLLQAGITLSLSGIEGVSHVRVSGEESMGADFMNRGSVLLDSDQLRLSVFEVEIYPIDARTGRLFAHKLRVLTEEETLSPQTMAGEFLSANLGENAPFDGRMDIRSVVGPNEAGLVRVELYVPAEMDLTGREADVYSVVNSLFASRRVESVSLLIGGSRPSARGLVGCDDPLVFDESYIGENGEYAYAQ